MSVVLPTPGGPTMATTVGGGWSSGVRSTRGTWRRVWSRSAVRRPCLSARRPDLGAKAWRRDEVRGKRAESKLTDLFVEAVLLLLALALCGLFLVGFCTRLRWSVRLVRLRVHVPREQKGRGEREECEESKQQWWLLCASRVPTSGTINGRFEKMSAPRLGLRYAFT